MTAPGQRPAPRPGPAVPAQPRGGRPGPQPYGPPAEPAASQAPAAFAAEIRHAVRFERGLVPRA